MYGMTLGTQASSDQPPRQADDHPFLPPAEGEDLPLYTQDNSDVWREIDELASALLEQDGDDLPLTTYPVVHVETPTTTRRAQIVNLYYDAITRADMQLLTTILERGLATAETTDKAGRTPLLTAVEAEKATCVRILIDAGANVNTYGITETMTLNTYQRLPNKEQHTYRTPLQYAAQLGNFTIVKILLENGANDALIAPDGQLALRLAATHGHREIAGFLPRRRGGGFKRWKVKHASAVRRVEAAALGILLFGKVIVYEIPKFFVWSVPKQLIVLPVVKHVKWLHAHRAEARDMVVEKMRYVWERMRAAPAGIWRGVKEAPGACVRAIKRTGKFICELVEESWRLLTRAPGAVASAFRWLGNVTKKMSKEVWKLITRIPGATAIALRWLWGGVKKSGAAIGNVVAKWLSFIHTAVAAVVSFFQRITLSDVWNGLVAALRAIFVDVPAKIWVWLSSFGYMCGKVFEKLFDCIGRLTWVLVQVLFQGIMSIVVYVPSQLGEMVVACNGSLKAAMSEVLVSFDPKRG
jgi:hypothetical protein